jgi:long-chain fatty acid transport protein
MSKRTPVLTLAAVLILSSFAAGNGFNLNGLGTRAQAMGGAYVSLANDFSAVFWNPAGAAGFRKELFGFYATDLIPRGTYLYESMIPEDPHIDAKTQKSHYLGFLGAYYRPVGEKVVVGLGFGTPSGLGAKWDGEDFVSPLGGTAFDWSSKVGVFSVTPLVAVKLNDWLSVGATFNVNLGTFELKQPGGSAYLGEGVVPLGQYEEKMTGWGFGATVGVMAKPVDKLSVGLTVRTPSTVSFKGSARLSYLSLYDLPDTSDLARSITWPLWIAGGVSFRPVERLVLSADVQWTQWSKLDRITTEYLDDVWAALMAADDRNVSVLEWRDATQIRFGAEYALNATTALRAGYYHDPAPGPTSTLTVLLPSHTFNAFSVGLGKTIGDLQLDFGLEFLSGDKREAGFDVYIWPEPPPWFMPGTYTMKIIVPSVSVQYKF